MALRSISSAVIVGAGNLGTHLARVFRKHGINILQVFDHRRGSAARLAREMGCGYVTVPGRLVKGSDLYLLTVSDSAIETVARSLSVGGSLVVHCSGSLPMNILEGCSENHGVFYPLQTFSASRPVSFKGIPICVEACNTGTRKLLTSLARKISGNVHQIDSRQRAILHLTAVFANNFTNFMFAAAEEILNKAGISYSLLEPIISQTARVAKNGSVFMQQTGPAIRGDYEVLEKHRQILGRFPEFLDLYNLISQNIITYKILHGKL